MQGREEAIILSRIEEEEKLTEMKRREVALNEMEEKRKKQIENESFLKDLVSTVILTCCYTSEHSHNSHSVCSHLSCSLV